MVTAVLVGCASSPKSDPDLSIPDLPDLSMASRDLATPGDLSSADLQARPELDLTVPADLSAPAVLPPISVDATATTAVAALARVTAPGAMTVQVEYGSTAAYGM